MILDGNTDWTPDDSDDAIDPGATVGIGPLPQRSPAGPAGSSGDPENNSAETDAAFAPSVLDDQHSADLGDADRPPMFAEGGPLGEDADPAPHGWIATGPLPAGAAGVEPLPTGPVPITAAPASVVTTSGSSIRVILQAGVVLLAAGLVGLVVFAVLRSAADDPNGDRAGIDRSDGLAIDPGPGVSGGGDDRLDSKRGTAGVGQQPESADDGTDGGRGQVGDDGDSTDGPEPAGPSTTSVIPAETDQAPGQPGAGDDGPTPSGADGGSGPPTSSGQRPLTPTTISSSGSTVVTSDQPDRPTTSATTPSTRPTVGSSTTRPTSTTSGGSSTTRPATTRPPTSTPSTTARPTTTTASTTTTVAMPSTLIVAPLDGSTVSWDARLRLRANRVPGAESYCWTMAGTGGELTQCSDGTELNFPASRAVPGPGTVKIRAEAKAGSGAVLLDQEISINLLARRFVLAPRAGRSVALDEGLRLQARRNPRADRYCWALSQGATRSGQICTANRRLDLPADAPALADFGPGPVTVRASAERNGVVIGRQSVAFEFTAS